ncbi:SagB/ThcOx family dehydrogenase [Halohasta salina]|uniref:SagB/ThcOx family dehydrogenase n=1 Tax=Halohasta salina TaxID=2961621 RepID=UPI0020A45D12|nr:SagB/ThcOx family dehydrogenase [Halohasta salina]
MALERPSRRTTLALLVAGGLSLLVGRVVDAFGPFRSDGGERWPADDTVSLPAPRDQSNVSVEDAIDSRRSRRTYSDRPLDRSELGQVLWAAQGVTDQVDDHRAAPSAGALYPLELYVVIGSPGVEGLDPGVYRYRPEGHELGQGRTGDLQAELRAATLDQEFVDDAPADIVICGVDERTTGKYGDRGRQRFVPMEAGHAGENLYLQAEALGLATVSVGAFDDDRVREVLEAPSTQRPLYVFPVGERVGVTDE